MTTIYDVGDLAHLEAVFTIGETGVVLDPTQVFLKYTVPGGATTTLQYGVDQALVKDREGYYHADVNLTTAGRWNYRWYSTGTGQAAEESYFDVRTQVVT